MFGIINGIVYVVGVWLGGYVVDKWGKKNKKVYVLLLVIVLIIGVFVFYFFL